MAVNDDINRILDIFGGADGGVGFARLKFTLEDLERRMLADDEAAKQLIDIVHKFRRLVDVLSKY